MSTYSTATIDATFNDKTEAVDLEDVGGENDMIDQLWAAFTAEEDEHNEEEREDFPGNVVFTNPQGFAVHLFKKTHPSEPGGGADYIPADNFDDILEKWNDETDEDRREAMGEYLEDMGADDLSDFDEAYQGQFDSGADFAQHDSEQHVPDSFPNWMVIDWEATWERNLRHNYHITDSGHVFRNL